MIFIRRMIFILSLSLLYFHSDFHISGASARSNMVSGFISSFISGLISVTRTTVHTISFSFVSFLARFLFFF